MSKVKIQGNASGTGVLTVTAPNTSTDRTITLPDGDVTLGAATPSIDDNGDATAITIDSSENVLVAQSSTAIPGIGNTTVGSALRSDGVGAFSVSGNPVAYFNRSSSDGTVVNFNKDGTTVGSIGVSDANNLSIDCTTADHSGLTFATENILPRKNSANTDNAIDLGAGSARFKDLYLSGGLKVGGTGAANTLDDYEEGTWTPASTSYGSLSVYSAKYTKIGRQVTLQVYVSGASANSNGVAISGLPFNNVSGGWSTGALNYASGNTNHTNPHVRVAENSGDVRLMKNPDTNLIGTEITGHIIFTVTYFMS